MFIFQSSKVKLLHTQGDLPAQMKNRDGVSGKFVAVAVLMPHF